MADQNLSKGDPVYPQYIRVTQIPITGNATPVSFVKGELATVNTSGRLSKLTTTKIGGLYQVMNAVTGGGANDNSVLARVMSVGSRILVNLPAGAKAGNLIQVNGTDGTGNTVISISTANLQNVCIGRVFELYKNTALTATAGDLGVVETGVY